jgi:polyphosphate kinase
MNRNLSRRIEVAYPIYEPRYKKRLMDFMDLYMNDNTKARVIDAQHQNKFVQRKKAEKTLNAQTAVWAYYDERFRNPEKYKNGY